jgi:hypothetical protein
MFPFGVAILRCLLQVLPHNSESGVKDTMIVFEISWPAVSGYQFIVAAHVVRPTSPSYCALKLSFFGLLQYVSNCFVVQLDGAVIGEADRTSVSHKFLTFILHLSSSWLRYLSEPATDLYLELDESSLRLPPPCLFKILSTLTEVFPYPDWGFSLPWLRFLLTPTEVCLPWLRFFRVFSSVLRQMPG